MGDGPGFDYLAEQSARRADEKKQQQKRRAEALHNVLVTTGFGETDGYLTPLEFEAAKNLRLAYEIFSELSR